jgi:VWFA-related protein
MLRAARCLLLAVTAASAQHLYIDATREELARAVPELAALQPGPAEKLDQLLRSAAETLNTSLDLFADVSAAERIDEMRFDGGVAASSRVENYRYGIRATLDGGEQLFTEFRIDPKTGTTARPPEVIQFLTLGHFMQTLSYLMPQYLSRSTFRYLGTVANFQVLAFAQKPGETLPRGHIALAAGAAPLQGLVWLDSSNRIVRLRTDLMGALEGFPLETAATDIWFAPVTFMPGSHVFWLPSRVTEHARFKGGEFHSVHRYSDYRSESQATVGSMAEMNTPDAYELTMRGIELAQAGKSEDAVRAWREALKMDSNIAAAHFALGNALRTSDAPASAAEFAEAARLAPDSALAHNALGVSLSRQGDAKGAAEEYRKTIGIAPKQAVAHFNLAQALEKSGDRPGALAEYRAAAELAPDNASFQARLDAFQTAIKPAAPQATIKVDVRQVLVPVVVTDHDGHRVPGLKREDFRVFEDGVEQKLAAFSVEDAEAPVAQTAANAPADAPTAGKPPTPAAVPIRRTYAICIDALHSDFGNMVRVRQAIRKLFETEREIDTRYLLIAVGTSTQILVNLTNDPQKVLDAVDSKDFQRVFIASRTGSTREEMRQFIRSLDQVRDSCDHGLPDCDPGKRGLPHRADAIERQERIVNMSFLDQLRNLVQQLARGHERRTVVMFSDGFQPFPGKQAYDLLAAYFPVDFGFMRLRGVEPLPDLEQVTRMAANNNIPFYTIDSRGLYTSGFYDASGGGTASRMAPAVFATTNELETAAGLTLSALAADTGGVAYHNSNDLFKGLERAFADGRQYYMLAYVPSNAATDGKFRAIAVRLKDEKLKIQTKKGYWADSP